MAPSKELSRDLHRNQTPSQESPEKLPDAVLNSPATNAAHTIESQKLKLKRGPTKLKTIAVDGGSRIEVKFDENGQPIGDGSIKLSSFLGPLVREIVPYTLSDWRKLPSGLAAVLWQSIQVRFNLHEEWHRELCFQKMVEVWRASKSRLVKKVKNAPNEEARLKLQPDNVKSLHDWKDFVKEKTSATFKVKSEKFQEMRKKQLELQHTMSRKGYARLTAELKAKKLKTSRVVVWATGHKKKDGRPSNTNVAQKINDMEKIELDTQSTPSTNLKEDPLSKVIGPERNGCVRTFGKGVTKTKLTILSQMNGQMAEIREENVQCKSEIARMRNEIDELKKNQAQNPATEGTPTTPIVSPSSVNTTSPHSGKCILLDWMWTGEVVAEGCWSSSDPSATVHHVPIGPNAMRVWVVVSKKPEMFLWRQTSFMTTIEEAVGSTVAWPADKVLMESNPGFMG